MNTIPQTTEQLTYYIRPGWIQNTWCDGGGYCIYVAVDAETHHVLPGTEDTDEEMVRWKMRADYRHYTEKGTVRA